MSYKKPRILNDYRDLFLSLIPLVLLCVVFAGAASQCSFSATGPTEGEVLDFDAESALTSDARSLPFPIRNPGLPEGWRPNSGSRDSIAGEGGGPVSTVGYLTPQGTYMKLSQTDATEEAVVGFELGTRYATGAEQIGDRTWAIYDEPGEEPAWVSDFGPVRVLITGAGNSAAFSTLAGAVGAAQPLQG